eukprot:361947-Chlamydomonas_euryale.AAC.4
MDVWMRRHLAYGRADGWVRKGKSQVGDVVIEQPGSQVRREWAPARPCTPACGLCVAAHASVPSLVHVPAHVCGMPGNA